jgi:hypothetical protein
MTRPLGSRLLFAGLAAVLFLAPLAGVTASAKGRSYVDRTSQGLPISFTISTGHIRRLRFSIYVTCPNGHVYAVKTWGYGPIRISRSRFAQTFRSSGPSGTARIKGRISDRRITGSLTVRRFIVPEGRSCSGGATFTIAR